SGDDRREPLRIELTFIVDPTSEQLDAAVASSDDRDAICPDNRFAGFERGEGRCVVGRRVAPSQCHGGGPHRRSPARTEAGGAQARNDAGTLRVQNQLTISSGARSRTAAAVRASSRSGTIATLVPPIVEISRRVPSAPLRHSPAHTTS